MQRVERGRVKREPARERRPRKIDLLNRRRQACELRSMRMSNLAVGLALSAFPEQNSRGEAVRGGYGWRNRLDGKPPLSDRELQHAVSVDVRAMLDAATLLGEESSRELLALELYTLDKAQAALMPQVSAGSFKHTEVFVRISERRAKLMGWDSEKRLIDANAKVSIHLAESPQPPWDPKYLAEFAAALDQAKAIPGPMSAAELVAGNPTDIEEAEIVDPAPDVL